MTDHLLLAARFFRALEASVTMFVEFWQDGPTTPARKTGGHCCDCEHADRACEHDYTIGFREDDLGLLFSAVERGALTASSAMAEFIAGVRGEPEDEDPW